ncbi:hypothetical protein E1267_08515 [Nonomuraea longispora]|uniref:AMP-dependent synthetase/ligase domain-containing protein n=1 Tax=Nonomuraea longispora TaxID=1848320 RepID=A0A4V2XL48_9ACTN|nr:AMP-binding protein [Nonomuraea longispora]TDC09026.1 hypothetical protein E1267_08515 [Nonomuraea longispora]
MRVHAVPAPMTVASDARLADVVFASDRVDSDMALFRRRSTGGWRPVTARRFAADVRSLAAGFLAAGIQPGDRIALLAATSYEGTLVDYALWTVAAPPVPIYETSSAEQVRWVLQDAGPVAAVVEHETRHRAEDRHGGAAPARGRGPDRRRRRDPDQRPDRVPGLLRRWRRGSGPPAGPSRTRPSFATILTCWPRCRRPWTRPTRR